MASFFATKPPPLCLSHAGKALSVGIVFPHMHVFALTVREKRCSRITAFPIGEGGTRQRCSGALVCRLLETHFPTLFHTARTLSGLLRSPPSPRGEGFVRRYCFLHVSCIRIDDARKAASSYRSFPIGEVFVSGIAVSPIQPPSLRGTSFPWKGLPSAARRGWLPFLRRSRLLFAFPMQGKRCYPCAIIHNQHCPYEGKPKRRRKHPAPLCSACIFRRKSAAFIF